jgi:hypothetical protein
MNVGLRLRCPSSHLPPRSALRLSGCTLASATTATLVIQLASGTWSLSGQLPSSRCRDSSHAMPRCTADDAPASPPGACSASTESAVHSVFAGTPRRKPHPPLSSCAATSAAAESLCICRPISIHHEPPDTVRHLIPVPRGAELRELQQPRQRIVPARARHEDRGARWPEPPSPTSHPAGYADGWSDRNGHLSSRRAT